MFTFTQKVLFRHCDPAGIVFYPKYYEMLNDVVEEFFDCELNYPFREVVVNNGVPAAQINATFFAPSRLGDCLYLDLKITKLGSTSLNLTIDAHCEGERRFSAALVLVYVNNIGKSTSWPDSIRQTLQNQMHGDKQ
ncbi:MAG: thioesterase family protein [Granulosicoccaceae bacterium]